MRISGGLWPPQLIFAVPTHLVTGIAVGSTNRPYAWQSVCSGVDAVSKPCDLTCTSMESV